jgi:hypothetical protein
VVHKRLGIRLWVLSEWFTIICLPVVRESGYHLLITAQVVLRRMSQRQVTGLWGLLQ